MSAGEDKLVVQRVDGSSKAARKLPKVSHANAHQGVLDQVADLVIPVCVRNREGLDNLRAQLVKRVGALQREGQRRQEDLGSVSGSNSGV